jgi:hypothetical protein
VAAAGGVSTPKPTSTSATSTRTTTTTTTSAQPGISRPRTIDLKGVDACQILAKLPAEFGIQGLELHPDTSLGFPGNTECAVINRARAFTLGITPVTTFDGEQFAATGRGAIARITIAGFPAFTQNLGEGNPACFAGVSVADGQMLYLQWLYNKSTGEPPTEVKCAEAAKAMTAAMAVLGAS